MILKSFTILTTRVATLVVLEEAATLEMLYEELFSMRSVKIPISKMMDREEIRSRKKKKEKPYSS